MFEKFISSMMRPRQVIIFAIYAVTAVALAAVYTGYAGRISYDYGELASFGAILLCVAAVNIVRRMPD